MYALLYIIGIAACVFLLIGSVMVFRKQQAKKTTLDKEVSLTTVRHPIIANPILILYVGIPILTVIIALIWISFTP